MVPQYCEPYGKELREKGIYVFAVVIRPNGELQRPKGYMELSNYQKETTQDLKSFIPNSGWDITPWDPVEGLAVVLSFSRLICLDVDVKAYPGQIQGMTVQEVRAFTQSLVPASWWISGCY